MELTSIDAILGPEQPSQPSEAVSDDEALDAYSRAVTTVAERLAPSVANLRVSRRVRGGRVLHGGGGSGVVTPGGVMLTPPHIVSPPEGRGEGPLVPRAGAPVP